MVILLQWGFDMKLTPALKKVNSWSKKKQTTSVGSVQALRKKNKRIFPYAMCLGTQCLSSCGYNCGVMEYRFMRLRRNTNRLIRNRTSCKQRAA